MRDLLTFRAAGPTTTPRPGLRWTVVTAAVIVLCLLPFLVLGDTLDRWTEVTLRSMTRPAGVFALVVALLALDTLLPVPSSVLATIAGHRLGFAGATVAITVGLCASNVVGYLIGRLAGSGAVERLVGAEQLARARALATRRPGVSALAVTRPVPILSEATILLAGAARTPAGPTLAVCALANTGIAMVYAGMGSAAHGPAALPLALAGSVGLPALAMAGTAIVVGRQRRNAHDPA
jgi:uncharacterized membrane protein YdjX (TVP38/TMEM64 family)